MIGVVLLEVELSSTAFFLTRVLFFNSIHQITFFTLTEQCWHHCVSPWQWCRVICRVSFPLNIMQHHLLPACGVPYMTHGKLILAFFFTRHFPTWALGLCSFHRVEPLDYCSPCQFRCITLLWWSCSHCFWNFTCSKLRIIAFLSN